MTNPRYLFTVDNKNDERLIELQKANKLFCKMKTKTSIRKHFEQFDLKQLTIKLAILKSDKSHFNARLNMIGFPSHLVNNDGLRIRLRARGPRKINGKPLHSGSTAELQHQYAQYFRVYAESRQYNTFSTTAEVLTELIDWKRNGIAGESFRKYRKFNATQKRLSV